MKFFFLILLVLFGCSTEKVNEPNYRDRSTIPYSDLEIPVSIKNTIAIDKDCSPKTWSTEWDKYIIDSLSSMESLKNYNPNKKYWVAVIKAIAKAESCLNLNERYVEKGLGKDVVTGNQNTSEGLLQLSYQDSKYHGCQFNWNLDKKLDIKSIDKTIFNPKHNLECGMVILNKQIKARDSLETTTPYYWAVLNKSNKRFKVFKKYLAEEGF